MNKFLKRIIPICLLLLVSASWRALAQVPQKKEPQIPIGDVLSKTTRLLDSVTDAILNRSKVKIRLYKDVVTKDFITVKGMFTIHKNKYSDTWLFEIPDSLLNRDILAVTRLSKTPAGSGFYAGDKLDTRVTRFEIGPDSVLDMKVDVATMRAKSGSEIAKAIVNADNNPVIQSFGILAYGPGKKSVVIDASGWIKNNSSFMHAIDGRSKKASISKPPSELSVLYVHTYPQNVELSFRKQVEPDGNLAEITRGEKVAFETTTSFVALPKTIMRQRYADKRVGYFSQRFLELSDNQQRSKFANWINRWRLEPKAGDVEKWRSGQLVEPQKQIVIYLDDATPKQWRPYFKAGINDWQKAFEQAGFKNAIIGKEWPEKNRQMSVNDARYSVLHYYPSDAVTATASMVTDPRSGEIIQADISWPHNILSQLRNQYLIQVGANDPEARHATFNNKMMGALIRLAVSQEVGHVLGLQDNLISSSFTPVESLRNQAYLEKKGFAASIMDKGMFNYVAQPEDHIKAGQLIAHIGEYDRWAIRWGYGPSKGYDAEAEKIELQDLTTEQLNTNPRLLWMNAETDRKATGDPRAQMGDLSDDAAKAGKYGIENLKRVVPQLANWTHVAGGNYTDLKMAYKEAENQYLIYINTVLNTIKGSYYQPNTEGQSGPVFTVVPKQKKLDALLFLDKELFATPTWLANNNIKLKTELPVAAFNFISKVQSSALDSLLSAEALKKLRTTALLFTNEALPQGLYLSQLHDIIWREVIEGNPVKDIYRRNLQRQYVQQLNDILNPPRERSNSVKNMFFGMVGVKRQPPKPQDPVQMQVEALIRADAQNLQREVKAAMQNITDKVTVRHLVDLDARLEALFEVNRVPEQVPAS